MKVPAFESPQNNAMDYYWFDQGFTPEELNKVYTQVATLPFEVASTQGGMSDDRKSKIKWIPQTEEWMWLYEKLIGLADHANKEMWNFDIWGYQDLLQYTKYYGNGGHYDWHADLGPGISNRKLSCVLQLSTPEEYEGGELQMNPGGDIMSVPKGLGTICFFPSFLLHRVTPLTSGTRKSLVTWLCGANLR